MTSDLSDRLAAYGIRQERLISPRWWLITDAGSIGLLSDDEAAALVDLLDRVASDAESRERLNAHARAMTGYPPAVRFGSPV